MARDDWREQRRPDSFRDERDFQRPADYGPVGSGGYDDRTHPGYRAAREDAWLDERRRTHPRDYARSSDPRAYQPFGATGPSAYGPYHESPYAWSGGYAPQVGAPYAGMEAGYGAARSDYAPPRYRAGGYGGPAAGDRAEESRSFLDKAADRVAALFGDHESGRRSHEDDLRAQHRGRGPKSYKRSDSRIQEDINDRLTDDPYLDATYIEVSVAEGDVTLTGLVVSREDKRRAERLAEEVTGVGDVQNNLRLRRPDGGEADQTPPGSTF